ESLTRIGASLPVDRSHAPAPRSAWMTSPLLPMPTAAAVTSPSSTSAMFAQYSGMLEANDRVPHIGSTSQYGWPGFGSPPRSSPITGYWGNSAKSSDRMASSHATSVSVTRSMPPFEVT